MSLRKLVERTRILQFEFIFFGLVRSYMNGALDGEVTTSTL